MTEPVEKGLLHRELGTRTGGFLKLVAASAMLAVQWLGIEVGEVYPFFVAASGVLGASGLWEVLIGQPFSVLWKPLEEAPPLARLFFAFLAALVFGMGAWVFFNGQLSLPKWRPA